MFRVQLCVRVYVCARARVCIVGHCPLELVLVSDSYGNRLTKVRSEYRTGRETRSNV